jgi:hypothetical protein
MHLMNLALTYTLVFSMMDLTGLLIRCKPFIHHWHYLTKIVNKMPSVLVICLCGGMLWQCSTCLIKYFDKPIKANIDYSQDFTMAPISITFCNKGTELNYTFPELEAVDIRQRTGADWVTVLEAMSSRFPAGMSSNNFIFSNRQNKLQLCKIIQVEISSASELRIRHHYSDYWKFNKMKVYLHTQGIFNAFDFSLALEKELFSSEKNFTLALSLETITSLNTPDFKCSEDTMEQTLDNCLVADAIKAANNSAGCIFKYLG